MRYAHTPRVRRSAPTLYGTRSGATVIVNVATLIVQGADGALLALKQTLPFSLESYWSKGDRMRSGAVRTLSGLSGTVSDCATPAELVVALSEFLAACVSRGIVLSSQGLEARISIGVTVGDSQQFVACIDLSREVLLALTASGVSLSFTAYPTSDEPSATSFI